MRIEKISIVVDGVTVQGDLERTGSDMRVEITSPYQGLDGHSTHIPHFARAVMSWYGERGDKVAAQILEELYRASKMLADRQRASGKGKGKKKKVKIKARKKDKPSSRQVKMEAHLVELRVQQKALKVRFKNAELTQQEYQNALKLLREEALKINEILRNARLRQGKRLLSPLETQFVDLDNMMDTIEGK